MSDEIARLIRERDEARAEVERLKALLDEALKAMPSDLRTHRGLRNRICLALTSTTDGKTSAE